MTTKIEISRFLSGNGDSLLFSSRSRVTIFLDSVTAILTPLIRDNCIRGQCRVTLQIGMRFWITPISNQTRRGIDALATVLFETAFVPLKNLLLDKLFHAFKDKYIRIILFSFNVCFCTHLMITLHLSV